MRSKILLQLLALLMASQCFSQAKSSDANIVGHVTSNGEHLPYINIYIEGTTIGTITDETGHFQLINVPIGDLKVTASAVGFKSSSQTIITTNGQTSELKFDILEDILGVDEVVITADRNEHKRTEAPVIVNTLTSKLFTIAQSNTVSESLNYCPGLRMESNCQNCGFSQVRMNGLEGPYSQILINSRPIFSGLAGVYGLELIPSNMIERIEVVRGGGSALFGSNAIAGTINLILKDPIRNVYELGINNGVTGIGIKGSGKISQDFNVNFNTSLVSDNNKTGVSVYGFHRTRDPFDVSGDGFSELTSILNNTLGTRLFHRFGHRSKIALDFFNISEARRGGNKFDYPEHEADIAESVQHNITSASLTYDQFFRHTDLMSIFFSVQKVSRDSYYGARQSLADYGTTQDLTYNTGIQYTFQLDNATLTFGTENQGSFLFDEKLGYQDLNNYTVHTDGSLELVHTSNTTVADQSMNTSGAFAQYDFYVNELNISMGARLDNYRISDLEHEGETKTGTVLSPRLTLKYDLMQSLQARMSYSQGYRAPQIFDEDLHIETSGSRKVIHRNDPSLKQETSHSYMASLDFNKKIGSVGVGLLIEGFYTRLQDAFANEYGLANEEGVVVYTRVNATGGATVAGVNLESNMVLSKNAELIAGFTFQKNEFDEVIEFNETRFFRTPNNYGYLTFDWDFHEGICFSSTGSYTGTMLNPYFGLAADDPEIGELRESSSFFDLGAKLQYDIELKGSTLQLSCGVKNIFNSYQNDFDYGVDRDPGYVYGPTLPRTVYLGVKFGNIL